MLICRQGHALGMHSVILKDPIRTLMRCGMVKAIDLLPNRYSLSILLASQDLSFELSSSSGRNILWRIQGCAGLGLVSILSQRYAEA